MIWTTHIITKQREVCASQNKSTTCLNNRTTSIWTGSDLITRKVTWWREAIRRKCSIQKVRREDVWYRCDRWRGPNRYNWAASAATAAARTAARQKYGSNGPISSKNTFVARRSRIYSGHTSIKQKNKTHQPLPKTLVALAEPQQLCHQKNAGPRNAGPGTVGGQCNPTQIHSDALGRQWFAVIRVLYGDCIDCSTGEYLCNRNASTRGPPRIGPFYCENCVVLLAHRRTRAVRTVAHESARMPEFLQLFNASALFTFPCNVYACYTQVLQAVVCVVLALIFDINQVDHQKAAEIINNISLAIVIVIVAINVIINAFDQNGIAQLLMGKTWDDLGPGRWTPSIYTWRAANKGPLIPHRFLPSLVHLLIVRSLAPHSHPHN